MLTEADILDALRDCYDPDIPLNIVDLGLVQAITIQPELDVPGIGIAGVPLKQRVSIVLTPTNPTESAGDQLSAQIANRFAGIETVSRTTITLIPEPRWTPRNITPAGRRMLGLEGNSSLVQIR